MKQFLLLALLALSLISSAQVTINITSVPSNTPPNDNLYIAGTFNGWDPGNASYALTKIDSSFYTITLGAGSGTIEFKFTRGDWVRVECQANGTFLPNRTFTYGNGDTINLSIAGWDDLINGTTITSTALPNVSLMADSFYMPQLDRYRKIWIYLPDDYSTATSKYYPVLYMQDGQNIFDDSTSFAGEWQVDETLQNLQVDGNYGCIVIGIENAGIYRMDEYSPYHNPYYGGGQGDEYCDFIVNTLKPYVDSHYRTLTTRDYTAIAGSSMGGLISFYAGMKYQDVFSKIGVFSPSFWFNDSIYNYTVSQGHQQPMRFYFVAGRYESADMVPDIILMYNWMSAVGFSSDELDTVIKTDGQHSEWFWDREFPGSYLWLFANTIASVQDLKTDSDLSITPNPAKDQIVLHSATPFKQVQIEIFNAEGKRMIFLQQSFSKTINTTLLEKGIYFLKVTEGKQTATKIFEVQR
ncbi:MAG: alpha/beta hydrolase-fold protein [Chitinophagales bacterium]